MSRLQPVRRCLWGRPTRPFASPACWALIDWPHLLGAWPQPRYLRRKHGAFSPQTSALPFSAGASQSLHETTAKDQSQFDAFEILNVSSHALDKLLCSEFNDAVAGEEAIQRLLKDSYRKLMVLHHPDKAVAAAAAAAAAAATPTDASAITHAYQTLRHIHSRASHRLDLLLGSADSESTNSTDIVGMEFLMEIMEVRSEMEDCIQALPESGKTGQDQTAATAAQQRLQQLWFENRQRTLRTNRALSAAWKERSEGVDELDLHVIQKLTAQLQYFHRIDETIREHVHVEHDEFSP
jgi:DnaJ-domain-containing protein 1